MTWNALVLAGSRGAEDPVALAAGVSHKAMADVAGRPMIHYVLERLQQEPSIGRIVVSGAGGLSLPPDVEQLAAEGTPATSVLSAFDLLGPPLLITTADNPLLGTESLSAFISSAVCTNADAVAAVATRGTVEQAGNPARRTYIRFKDGEVSGCNLFALMTPEGREAIEFWRKLEVQRKRPWRMAMAIGLGTLLRYFTGQLSQAAAMRALSERAGCCADIVKSQDPFAAHDVDKPGDLVFAERVLTERPGKRG